MNSSFQKSLEVFTFDFTSQYLSVYGSYENPYFLGKEVGDILKIKKINNRLASIPTEDKVARLTSTLGGQQEMTYINEYALYEIILSTRATKEKKDLIQNFKRWVTHEVLPQIRKTGKYEIKNQVRSNEEFLLEQSKHKLDMFKTFQFILTDDRDIVLLKDYARDLICGKHSNHIESNPEIAISRRLLERFQVRRQNNKYALAIGKRMAKRYREINEKDPPQRDQYVGGTLRLVNHYTLKDYTEFGDEVIREYLIEHCDDFSVGEVDYGDHELSVDESE
jgi:prophage antirepressor-like protein